MVIVGCFGETDTEKYDRLLTEMDCPVVLLAKTGKDEAMRGIVLMDGRGNITTMEFFTNSGNFSCCSDLPIAINNSKEIGDTIKPCMSANI